MHRDLVLTGLIIAAACAAFGSIWLLPDKKTPVLVIPTEDASESEPRALGLEVSRQPLLFDGRPDARTKSEAYVVAISTRTPNGETLPDVTLTFVSEPLVVELGKTSQEGVIRVSLGEFPASVGSGYVSAMREGYELKEVTVTEGMVEAHSVEIIMDREAVLSGQVVDWNGNAVGAGVRVAAWGNGVPPRLDTAIRAYDGDAAQTVSITDSEGHFEIPRLVGDDQYSVVAAGAGWVSVEPARVVPDEWANGAFTIRVSALYGAEARVIDAETEEEVDIDPFVTPGPPYSGRVLGDHDAVEVWDKRVLALAGAGKRNGWKTRGRKGPFFVRKDSIEERVGPLAVSLHLVGYERGGGRLWLGRVRDSILVADIVVQPVDRPTGMLSVLIKNAGDVEVCELSKGRSFSTMTLSPRNSEEMPVSVGLRPVFGEVQEVGQVPCGEYTVGVHFFTNLTLPNAQCPIEVLTVTEEGGKVDLDLSGLAQANVVLRKGGASVTYRGPIQLSLVRDGPNATDRFVITCSGPPYYLPPVVSGRYHAQARLCDALDPAYEQKAPRGESRLVDIPSGEEVAHRNIVLEAW